MKFNLGNLGGTIMYKNEPIVSFKFERDMLKELTVINKDVRPIPFEFNQGWYNEYGLRSFFYYRITPPTRSGIDEALAKSPIKYYSPERMIRYNSGRCIHDPFWLKCDDDYTNVEDMRECLEEEKRKAVPWEI